MSGRFLTQSEGRGLGHAQIIGNILVGTMILPHLERRQNPLTAFDSITEIFHAGILNTEAKVAQTAFVGGPFFSTTDT